MKFKFLAHTADIKFQAFGKTIGEVFKNSALALFNIIYDKKISEKMKFKIKAKGRDLENLMYNFLEEFLVLIDSKNFLPAKIKNLKLNKKNFKINAEVIGDDAKNYNVSEHVKAITYNEMFIKKIGGKWVSQVVLDV
ncbi:MAG: archease [Nanoarchaeota archaeon]|nr:archease [Nanoarchaeota archaeon]